MLRDLIQRYRSGDSPSNVIEFCESRWGLNQELFPTQRFVLKLFYGLPLNGSDKTIEITDKFREQVRFKLTEKEYLKFLSEEGRCNWADERGSECHELVLVIGRRGSKSKMTSIISCFEFFELLKHYSPQEYFRLPLSDEIYITNVATAKSQALYLFNSVSHLIKGSERLRPFLSKEPLSQSVKFRTQYEIDHPEIYGDGFGGTIRGQVGGSNSRSIRGSGSIVVVLDELAHFLNTDGTASDHAVYDALTPSIAAFTHPNDRQAGKIISLSSPLGKSGKLYELYEYSLDPSNSDEDILMIQAPTWEINPKISGDYLRSKYKKGPAVFEVEHGAQFSHRAQAWVEDSEHFDKNISSDWDKQIRGDHRRSYYMGLDFGGSHDGSAIAISHWDHRERKAYLDYHAVYFADRGEDQNHHYRNTPDHYERTGIPISHPYQKVKDLCLEISALCKDFTITKGVMDQWSGPSYYQTLQDLGLTQFEFEHFTETKNAEVYNAFKQFYQDTQLVLYSDPLLLWELKNLQAQTRRKYVTIVSAPASKGMHDDLSDAVARSIWLIQRELIGGNNISNAVALGPGGKSSEINLERSGHERENRKAMLKSLNSQRVGQVMRNRRK